MAKLTFGSVLLALVSLVFLTPACFIIFLLMNEGGFIGVIPLVVLVASALFGGTCLVLAVRDIVR